MLNKTSIPFYRTAVTLQIAVIVLGSTALVAGFIWALVFIVTLAVEGLRVLTSTIAELNSLVASQPALHFLFLLALTCLCLGLAVNLVTSTYRYARGVYGK